MVNSPGKPAFDIPAELLEDLLGLEFTLLRRCWEYLVGIDYGLGDFRSFSYSKLPDDKSKRPTT